MRLDNPEDNTVVGASSSSTPPLHAEVRAALKPIIAACVQEINTLNNMGYAKREDLHARVADELDATASEALQAVADALLSELPKAIESVEVDVEATRRHMESKGATENEIMNMEIEADDRRDVLKDALDAVTRVIGEQLGRRT